MKSQALLITDENAIDSDNFALCNDYSDVGVDEDKNSFFVAYDRIIFSKLPEVIQTIIEASGYVYNFENILSCLERMQFAVRVAPQSGRIKKGTPCLVVGFPDKDNIGVLLKSFYQEISKYENIISSYHSRTVDDSNIKQLKEKVSKLENENIALQKQIKHLTSTISYLKSSHAIAVASKNTLPADMLFARIKSVAFKDRSLLLRSKNMTFRANIALCEFVPQADKLAIIKIDVDKNVVAIFLYGEELKEFSKSLCTVLSISDDSIKLRDEKSRDVYLFHALNDNERRDLENVSRGDKVIAYLHKHDVIKFSKLTGAGSFFADLMYENVAKSNIYTADDRDEKSA